MSSSAQPSPSMVGRDRTRDGLSNNSLLLPGRLRQPYNSGMILGRVSERTYADDPMDYRPRWMKSAQDPALYGQRFLVQLLAASSSITHVNRNWYRRYIRSIPTYISSWKETATQPVVMTKPCFDNSIRSPRGSCCGLTTLAYASE